MNKSQRGFALIEGLVIVLILAIVGFGGYYVWHNQKDNKTTPSKTSNTKASSSTATPPDTTKYLTIDQWGVRAPLSGSLAIEYTLGSKSSLPWTASFSSSELDASDTECASTKDGGGYIDRYLKSDDFKMNDGTSSGQTAAQFALTLDKSSYAQVGDYYYFFVHSQGACGSSASSQALQTRTNDSVMSMLADLQAIPQ